MSARDSLISLREDDPKVWVPAIPLPLYGLRKKCFCGAKFRSEASYRLHYAEEHGQWEDNPSVTAEMPRSEAIRLGYGGWLIRQGATRMRAERQAELRGWLDDIEHALRGIWTNDTEEDEAFDAATASLDALRAKLDV